MRNPEITHINLQFKLMGRGYLFDYKEEDHNYQKFDVLQAWGEPDAKKVGGEIEYWIYKQDSLAWAGLIPMVIIPIPLVVPVGKNSVTLGFSGDELVSAVSQDRDGAGGVCGMFLMDHPSGLKFGCFSLSDEE